MFEFDIQRFSDTYVYDRAETDSTIYNIMAIDNYIYTAQLSKTNHDNLVVLCGSEKYITRKNYLLSNASAVVYDGSELEFATHKYSFYISSDNTVNIDYWYGAGIDYFCIGKVINSISSEFNWVGGTLFNYDSNIDVQLAGMYYVAETNLMPVLYISVTPDTDNNQTEITEGTYTLIGKEENGSDVSYFQLNITFHKAMPSKYTDVTLENFQGVTGVKLTYMVESTFRYPFFNFHGDYMELNNNLGGTPYVTNLCYPFISIKILFEGGIFWFGFNMYVYFFYIDPDTGAIEKRYNVQPMNIYVNTT